MNDTPESIFFSRRFSRADGQKEILSIGSSTENFDVDEMANLAMAILLIRHQNHQLFKETLLPK